MGNTYKIEKSRFFLVSTYTPCIIQHAHKNAPYGQWSLWGNPGMARCQRKNSLSCWIHPAAQSTGGKQQWDLLVSYPSVGFRIKIGRPKFYAGEMITLA